MHVNDSTANPLSLMPARTGPGPSPMDGVKERPGSKMPPRPGTYVTGAEPTKPTVGSGSLDPASANLDPLTLEGLQEAWGSKDSRYDLDGSGLVDMKDLVMLLAQLAQGEKPNPEGTVATGTDAPPDVDAGAVAPAPAELTVDGLMEAWGQKGGEYDLDGNGMVDMNDLLKLLAGMTPDPSKTSEGTGNMAPPDEAIGTAGPAAPATEMTVEGLMEAWGQKGGEYDLDGSGQVGMQDLLALLAQLAQPAESGKTPDAAIAAEAPSVTDPALVDTAPAEPQLSVKGLLNEWGERGSDYDLNGDGTVNMDDLLALLRNLTPEGGSNPAEMMAALEARMHRAGLVSGMPQPDMGDRLQTLSDSLVQRLRDNGFEQHPPDNIHQIIDHFKLGPEHRQNLLANVEKAYPGGLGLNVVG